MFPYGQKPSPPAYDPKTPGEQRIHTAATEQGWQAIGRGKEVLYRKENRRDVIVTCDALKHASISEHILKQLGSR
jgi:hypothetical protein